jgi:recombination associated protein RdgC
MLFKNLVVYTLGEGFELDVNTLSELLEVNQAQQLTALQELNFGWVSPSNTALELFEVVGGKVFIVGETKEKILLASVVNDILNERLDQIETDEGRRPVKKEREQLKENIRIELLPQAFYKTRRTAAYIDVLNGLLVVDAASEKVAD